MADAEAKARSYVEEAKKKINGKSGFFGALMS